MNINEIQIISSKLLQLQSAKYAFTRKLALGIDLVYEVAPDCTEKMSIYNSNLNAIIADFLDSEIQDLKQELKIAFNEKPTNKE